MGQIGDVPRREIIVIPNTEPTFAPVEPTAPPVHTPTPEPIKEPVPVPA